MPTLYPLIPPEALTSLPALLAALLTMSLSASAAALAVMGLRLFLKNLPRRFLLVLWGCVLVRMLSPFALGTEAAGILPPAITGGRAAAYLLEASLWEEKQSEPPRGQEVWEEAQPTLLEGPQTDSAQPPAISDKSQAAPAPSLWEASQAAPTQPLSVSEEPQSAPLPRVLALLWLTGTAGMLLWAVFSCARLRGRVAEGVRVAPGVYESDAVASPFVLGRRIYLPAGLTGEDRRYVLLHERAHIAAGDPWYKALAWCALSLHWWNPVLWLAYRLLCRDLETACDQRVVDGFPPEAKRRETAGYAQALLHLSRGAPIAQGVLPFGEGRRRIEGVLRYRRPPEWVLVLAGALVAAAWCLLLLSGPPPEGTAAVRGEPIWNALLTDLPAPERAQPPEEAPGPLSEEGDREAVVPAQSTNQPTTQPPVQTATQTPVQTTTQTQVQTPAQPLARPGAQSPATVQREGTGQATDKPAAPAEAPTESRTTEEPRTEAPAQTQGDPVPSQEAEAVPGEGTVTTQPFPPSEAAPAEGLPESIDLTFFPLDAEP